MNDGIDSVPMMLRTPSIEALDQRLRESQRMFHRSLACWASDVLLLRQAKLHHFTWRSDDAPGWSSLHSSAA